MVTNRVVRVAQAVLTVRVATKAANRPVARAVDLGAQAAVREAVRVRNKHRPMLT